MIWPEKYLIKKKIFFLTNFIGAQGSNIEIIYEIKNNFEIRTCSQLSFARTLFFLTQFIMNDIFNVLK